MANKGYAAQANSASRGTGLNWDQASERLKSSGHSAFAQNLGAQAEFQAQGAAWEAKNNFAQSASGMAGVYGVNAGSLAPGNKPTDRMGMAMEGLIGSGHRNAASFSGGSFLTDGTFSTDGGFISQAQNMRTTHNLGEFSAQQVEGAYVAESMMGSSATAVKENFDGRVKEPAGKLGEIFK